MGHSSEHIFMNQAAATGDGLALFVKDYDVVVITLNTSDSGSGTIKFQGAVSDSFPDFGAAQSVSNRWDYIEVIDLEDGAAIDGDTGIVLSGTDDHRVFEVNTNHLTWVNVNITAYAAGKWTVRGVAKSSSN